MIKADNTQKQCFIACSEEDKKNGRCSCLLKGISALQSLQSCVTIRISCDERLPMCYGTGNWDGKKSDNFIGKTITGKQFIGCLL